jgi:uncharacterized membrane protein
MTRALLLAFAIGGRTLAALLSFGIALYSYRYLTGGPMRGPAILANTFANPFLVLHVGGAATALLVGPFQFLAQFRNRKSGLHRIVGRIYVAGCLLGATAGFPLALGSTAGPVASGGFGTLSVCWFAATVLGWRHAVQRRFAEHRVWMLRSWAMTFAAVTLRLALPVPPLLGVDFLDGYRAISWLCWTVNLAVLELYLRRSAPRKAPTRHPAPIAA